jgi:hypothetical protein
MILVEDNEALSRVERLLRQLSFYEETLTELEQSEKKHEQGHEHPVILVHECFE